LDRCLKGSRRLRLAVLSVWIDISGDCLTKLLIGESKSVVYTFVYENLGLLHLV
jgi:hypothetical protein